MSVFLDTNILIHTISTADSDLAKQAIAIALLERPDCVLSVQVFQEFYTQATRPTRPGALSHAQAVALITGWKRFHIVENTIAVFEAAIALRTQTGYSFWDCSILAAAQASGCKKLYSEDMAHGRAVGGVTIVNPFRPA